MTNVTNCVFGYSFRQDVLTSSASLEQSALFKLQYVFAFLMNTQVNLLQLTRRHVDSASASMQGNVKEMETIIMLAYVRILLKLPLQFPYSELPMHHTCS